MSKPKLISPLLDGFVMGEPISAHHGVCCCPAMELSTEKKYIVKIISVPASPLQLEALLLTGAYSSKEAAIEYFSSLTQAIDEEAKLLKKLSELEGYFGYSDWQIAPMEDESGFDIYLISPYSLTLEHLFRQQPLTHLGAVNLGIDLCSALTVARRAGHLYVDLKPENIFITEGGEYRIGDLGFIPMSSLKYASLPEKYRSAYTPPEIEDAYSALNTTLDTYALGLILYQAFHNNTLPEFTEDAVLQPPAYADYEMTEIILKACHKDTSQRWEDPVQMGQALVSYLQRNTVNDTPILPPATPEEDSPDEIIIEDIPQEENPAEEIPEEILKEITETVTQVTEDSAAEDIPEEDSQEALEEEPEQFALDGFEEDETAPTEESAEGLEDTPVSEEVTEILQVADDLIAHEPPAPAIVPEPVEILIPNIENEQPQEEVPEEDQEEQFQQEQPLPEQMEIQELTQSQEQPPVTQENRKASPSRVTNRQYTTLITVLSTILVLLLLAIGGLFFYEDYYLQSIDSMTLTPKDNELTVTLDTETDNKLLKVVCKDTYGNTMTQQVVNNKAVFRDLRPGTKYTVTVHIDGFHQLTGNTAGTHTTTNQTTIVDFSAVTGDQDGTVILNFSIQGPENTAWRIQYSAPGIPEKMMPCSSHMAVITGLEVGATYSFRLVSVADLYLVGNSTLEHTVSKVIYPENLRVLGFDGKNLNISWSAPADTQVESWTVRCFNSEGYDNTFVVSQPSATISDLDITKGYTIDVKAAGMSESKQVVISPNSITLQELKLDTSKADRLGLSWSYLEKKPQGQWQILYRVDGSDAQLITSEKDSCSISPIVPGGHYEISVSLPGGTNVFAGTVSYDAPKAKSFNSYKIKPKNLTLNMCPTPEDDTWQPQDISKKKYTKTFSPGQLGSFIIKSSKTPGSSDDNIAILFVIRDANGQPVSINSHSRVWNEMWNGKYCKIEMPFMPATSGQYTVDIFFNGALLHTHSITVK